MNLFNKLIIGLFFGSLILSPSLSLSKTNDSVSQENEIVFFYSKKIDKAKWEVYGGLDNSDNSATCILENKSNKSFSFMISNNLITGEFFIRMSHVDWEFGEAEKGNVLIGFQNDDGNVKGPYKISVYYSSNNEIIIPNLQKRFFEDWLNAKKFILATEFNATVLDTDQTPEWFLSLGECIKTGKLLIKSKKI